MAVGSDLPYWDKYPRLGSPIYLRPFHPTRQASQVGTANRVFIQPMWVPRPLTIDLAYILIEVLSVGNNVRIGIYADNGETPAGGALLYDSGNIDVTTTGLKSSPVITPPLRLPRGLVWVCVATQDATMAFSRDNNFPVLPTPFMGCSYDLGGWGALSNPCPAVAANSSAKLIMNLHIASFDP